MEKKIKKKFHLRKDDMELTLLSLPTIIWFFVFSYLPMFGIIIVFKKFRIVDGQKSFLYNLLKSDWAGLSNFKFLLESRDMRIIVRNTLVYNLIFILLGIIIPVTLALLISQIRSKRAKKLYQTAMLFPHFMSWVVVTYFVWAFLSYEDGFINHILLQLGKEPIQWYMEGTHWPFILVFMNVWKGAGYGMIIYLAAITGIDPSYYEAAVIDGASIRQQVRFITLPLIKTIIIMMFILNIGSIFYSDFGLFYQITQDSNSLYDKTIVLDVYVYKALRENGNIGMASAASFIQSVLSCCLVLITNKIVTKLDAESALI
ncbi:ABC transporter permease [Anaerocolumna sp. MB42-C2]|uniref:ABC transporter permease n=1 Tax=Anaerocolumna sp. MB42-C2 TaxID=3070997 RepID=UPI0027E009A1|nr:ABC transporter permease subunit [Anaerocolumna sp. MB42-C2]WMJ87836.1 ABC transporter permease subunit [Anaerocolumna sp. MB42-C2]